MTAGRRTQAINFTVAALKAIETPKTKPSLTWDTTVKGLGLMVRPTNKRSFFWFRRCGAEKKLRWVSLGEFPDLSVENARSAATGLNSEAATWKSSGFTSKAPRLKKNSDPTLGEANESYCERHLRAHAKDPDRRIKETKALFTNHLDHWKDRKLSAITRQDVTNLHDALGEKPGMYAANYVVQHLRALYNWAAERRGYDGQNPARIKLFKEKKRARFLQYEEMQRFYGSLDADTNQDAKDFVLLALYTGQRKGNVLAMPWKEISLKGRTWLIPDPKNEEPQLVSLTAEALEILQRRHKAKGESQWVFPSATSVDAHTTDFNHQWQRIRKAAGLTDVRFHDLRHNFASWLSARNASAMVLKKALGHQSIASTERYAHLNLDPIRVAVAQATAAMKLAGKSKRKKEPTLPALPSLKRAKLALEKAGVRA
jgi:integrase